MRNHTLLVATLLLLASLTVTPSAQAIGCPGPNLTVPGPDGDIATHSYYPGCGFDLYLNEGKECAGGDDDWNHIPLWLVALHFNTCGDPDGGVLNDPFWLVSNPPVLRPFTECPGGLTPPGALQPHVRSDCNPDPHAYVVGPRCPGVHQDRFVAYENVTVSYEDCRVSAPPISNPFYRNTYCRSVPQNTGIATITEDCGRVRQDGCDAYRSNTFSIGAMHYVTIQTCQ